MDIQHIALILDGNRRFAKQIMKRPWEGHRFGLEKAREVLQWSCEAGIKYMTAYALSLENISSRPRRELHVILRYFENEMDNILGNAAHTVHAYRVKVRFIGRIALLPGSLRKKMRLVENATKGYGSHFLNIAVAYGGQQELVDAVKEIAAKCLKGILKPSDLNEEVMKKHLYTNGHPFPDLIIRSGGEKRLSNFLPYQSAYSELIFTDKKWPELTRKDFKKFLEEYRSRSRRFGK